MYLFYTYLSENNVSFLPNINSVYHVYLIGLIEKIIKCKKNDHEEENNLTRLWQRLINAKSIHFSVSLVSVTNESIILNKL